MTGKSGAGAATSSGVNYQSRVAGYLLATALCGIALPEFQNDKVVTIGFETLEAVDDLNIALDSGRNAYLQVKRSLSFSTSVDSEMYSVLKQFAKQFTNTPKQLPQLFLVTTSDSFQKIVGEMKAALDAFRHGPEEAFRRDQPKAVKQLLDELLNTLCNILGGKSETSRASAAALLRSAYIWPLDLQDGSCLLFEFYRFDDDCKERIRFDKGICFLSNGLVIQVLHRTATVAGMERFIKERPDVIGNRELTILPFNTDKDLEKGICADRYRALMRNALLKNADLLKCVHCGKSVSSSAADIVESGLDPDIRVGIAHRSCTRVDDRVLGVPKGDFFTRFPYLVNFDANLWFKAAQRGQGVFAHRRQYERSGVIAWSGRHGDVPPGDFIVECKLVNGLSEFLHERGQIHRFNKGEGDQAATLLNANIETARKRGDPFCFSDQSKAFGRRSTLLKFLGVSEQLVEISEALVVQFQQEIANAYAVWENWYAPLAYLRIIEDGSTLTIGGFLPVLTNPFTLDRHLENWKISGIEIPEYEVVILQNDHQFDDFAANSEEYGVRLIVDPLVDPTGAANFIAGIPIQSMQELLQRF